MKMNQQWLVANHPVGAIQTSDFIWNESTLAHLGEGMVQIRTIYLSLDPTNRVWLFKEDTYLPALQQGNVMRGLCIGKVTASDHPTFKVGDIVQGLWGWQSYHTSDGSDVSLLPALPGLPLTAHFGLLGHIGIAAHYGMLGIGKPKAGETVVVSAAAGAVGSLAGQIAKLQGAYVVGIAGSDEKCRRLTEDLKFDAAINYKKGSIKESLERQCPKGIDVYFENVGGEILDAVLGRINNYGRIVGCGLISLYNQSTPGLHLTNIGQLFMRSVLLQAFICLDQLDTAEKIYSDLLEWHKAGKLQYQVEQVNGLENAPATLQKFFNGSNKGKLIIKVSDENE